MEGYLPCEPWERDVATGREILAVVKAICQDEVLAVIDHKRLESTTKSKDSSNLSESAVTLPGTPIPNLVNFDSAVAWPLRNLKATQIQHFSSIVG